MTQNIEQAGHSAAEVIDPDPSAPEAMAGIIRSVLA